MRITIDFDRVNRVPRIRSKWQSSGKDDIRMQNLGLAVYQEWCRFMASIGNKFNDKEIVFEDKGMVQ